MEIKPLPHRILIRRDPVVEQIGKIIVPDTSQDLQVSTGTVVAVFDPTIIVDDVSSDALGLLVEVGQRVLFGRYAGSNLNEEGINIEDKEDLVIMQQSEIMAVLEEE